MCLERCLRSLVAQKGLHFEVIVVDDHSSDRTREIAEKFARVKDCPVVGTNPGLIDVRVINAPELQAGWTGKSNACWAGAQVARGSWLLFTDADTEHLPGSLAHALQEAEENRAALLSYSPAQEVHTLPERVLMPVIFAELATTYKPRDVRDPKSDKAAANGQYLLVRRDVYDKIGGHAAVASELLEDVALAKLVKRSGAKLHFRYGGDAVRTRMYRDWAQIREGWTKNLALLFAKPRSLAAWRVVEFAAMSLLPITALIAVLMHLWIVAIVAALIAAPT